jgi:hypothetical protein
VFAGAAGVTGSSWSESESLREKVEGDSVSCQIDASAIVKGGTRRRVAQGRPY